MNTTFDRLLPLARRGASSHVKRTATWGIHGVSHWRAVARNGRLLAALTPGADADVVDAFAALHDSQRNDDGGDRFHGLRASVFVAGLHVTGKLGLTESQALLLVRAVRRHRGSGPHKDPTIGCCLDADRLDLPRIGVLPDPKLMSTKAGKMAAR